MRLNKFILSIVLASTAAVTYATPTPTNNTITNEALSAQAITPINLSNIVTTYNTWWSTNHKPLNFEGKTYDLIANDGSGQGSGSTYTSEGIGFGMMTSAMIMYIYETKSNSGISKDLYETASKRFDDGFNYWVAAENSSAEQSNKSQWVCYQDKLLVWTRDAQGNPNGTGSATDGDFYMTGAVYLAAKAYQKTGNQSEYNTLISWAKDRSIEISSRDFNGNNHSNPFSVSASTPSLPAGLTQRLSFDQLLIAAR